MKRTIISPASTSNLGPGFDALGLGVGWGIEVSIEAEAPAGFSVQLEGEGRKILPADGRNMILKVAREIAGDATDRAAWRITSRIPVARGLGSSAAARCAGLAAGYLLRDGALPPRHVVFEDASRHENHPDNASACVFGGLRVCSRNGSEWLSWPSPILDSELQLLLVIPEVPVETSQARAILPTSYTRAATVRNLQSMSVLLSGLARGDWEAVRAGCRDQMHEPYRLPLVPGLSGALDSLREDESLGGAWLSGAGPTLAAFLPAEGARSDSGEAAVACLSAAGIGAAIHRVPIDLSGLRIEEDQ